MNDFFTTWKDNENYFRMLSIIGSLSNLFSDSDVPYIDYRATENIFCKYFLADNLSRSDTAYDARLSNIGIGIKTFVLKNKNYSEEKIAEFNALAPTLKALHSDELAWKIATYRNNRIESANGLYNIESPIYHIVGRSNGSLKLFNTQYKPINLDKIRVIKEDDKSIKFSSEDEQYTYTRSKSVLKKKFILPTDFKEVNVDILNDPFKLLEQLFQQNIGQVIIPHQQNTRPFVILPLFSNIHKTPVVPEKSGLNQWNANGRARDENEVYIPIPRAVHQNHPNFFPPKDTSFKLKLPNNRELDAKVCQDGEKALMSNPNKVLGKWILREVLHVKPGRLVTIDDLNRAGFDSIVVYKNSDHSYSIDVSREISYEY